MIEEVIWHLGGMDTSSSSAANYYKKPASTYFTYERSTTTSSVSATKGTGHIGLMYPSDYGYAVLASSCARGTSLYSYNTAACGGQNWLHGKCYEWTITPRSDNTKVAFDIAYSGHVMHYNVPYGFAVRPVLYLSSSVYVTDGDGSISSPYVLKM